MYVFVWVCMYVLVWVCMYVLVWVCIYTCMNVRMYVCAVCDCTFSMKLRMMLSRYMRGDLVRPGAIAFSSARVWRRSSSALFFNRGREVLILLLRILPSLASRKSEPSLYLHVWMYVCIWVCECVYVCMCVCVWVCVCVCVCVPNLLLRILPSLASRKSEPSLYQYTCVNAWLYVTMCVFWNLRDLPLRWIKMLFMYVCIYMYSPLLHVSRKGVPGFIVAEEVAFIHTRLLKCSTYLQLLRSTALDYPIPVCVCVCVCGYVGVCMYRVCVCA
jgi:hypothetical protein